MLYRTTDYAAGFIVCMFQCLLATPQMRLFLERLQWPRTESRSKGESISREMAGSADQNSFPSAQSALTFMQGLLRASSYHKSAYIEVDTSQLVDMDFCNYTMASPLSERLRGKCGWSLHGEYYLTTHTSSSNCGSALLVLRMRGRRGSTYSAVIGGGSTSRRFSSYPTICRRPAVSEIPEANSQVSNGRPALPRSADARLRPFSLLKSFGGSIHGSTDPWQATMCPLEHDAAQDHHIMQCISRAVWAQEPNQLLFSIADIFAIGVRKAPRSFGEGVVGVMQLEEELYMGM